MFYDFDNIDNYLFEKALEDYWDCPEAFTEWEDEEEEEDDEYDLLFSKKA